MTPRVTTSRARRSPTRPPTTPRSYGGSTLAALSVKRRTRRRVVPETLHLPRAFRGRALRREPAPGRRALPHAARHRGGTGSPSTPAPRCRTSTSSTPTLRGDSCTSSCRRARTRGGRDHQARQRLGRRGRDSLAEAFDKALRPTPRAPSGASSPSTADRRDTRVAHRRGPQADVIIAWRFDDDAIAILVYVERPPDCSAPRRPSLSVARCEPSATARSCRTPTSCSCPSVSGRA